MNKSTSMSLALAFVIAAGGPFACNYRADRLPERERVIGDAPSPAAAQPVRVVRMTDDLRFEPEVIRVRVGDTVEWRNASGMAHTVTLDPQLALDPGNVAIPLGAEPFDSGRITAGRTYRHTFDVPGRYRYVCLVHEDHGMVGEVEVIGP